MDDTTQHDEAETDPTGNDADEQDKEHDGSFDPEQVENDPAHNPPVPGLKDLKGG